MRYFETSLTPLDKPPKSKFISITPVGVKAMKSSPYLSKYASLEKQGNPLAWFLRAGAHLMGEGGGAWLSRVLGSKGFATASKWLGSQGTLENLAVSKNPFIKDLAENKILSSSGQNIKDILQTNAGANRFVDVSNKLSPSVQRSFKDLHNPEVTLSKAWSENSTLGGKAKGTLKWLGNQFGIGDNIKGNLGRSFKDSLVASRSTPGMVYQGSRLGNLTRTIANKGIDTYFIGDSFLGSLEPGETRTGKILGNMGMLGGYRSSNRILGGILRGTTYGMAGSYVGNKIGKQKPLPQQPRVYFDPNTNEYKYI